MIWHEITRWLFTIAAAMVFLRVAVVDFRDVKLSTFNRWFYASTSVLQGIIVVPVFWSHY